MNKKGHIALSLAFVEGYNLFFNSLPSFIQNPVFLFDLKIENAFYVLSLILLAVAGGIIPDFDLKLNVFFNDRERKKRYLYHRQLTHSLILWAGTAYYSLQTSNPYLFYFALGGISHLFGDMLTGSVPVFLWGKYYRPYRIGLGIIYKNPSFYQKVAGLFDKPLMIFITVFAAPAVYFLTKPDSMRMFSSLF